MSNITTSTVSFIEVLQHLNSPNNQIRQEAENYYNSMLLKSPDEIIIGLMQILANQQVVLHIRQLSAILLRRSLIDEEDSYYFKLNLQSRHFVITEISRLLLEEQDTAVRIKICDIAGELGGSILEPKDWPSLYPTTIHLCRSGNHADREVGLSLIGLLSESAISQYDDFLANIFEVLLFNFQQNSQSGKALTLTVRALNEIVQSVKLTSQLEVLQPLVLPLFQSISEFLQQTVQVVKNVRSAVNTPASPSNNLINAANSTSIEKQFMQSLCNYFETLIDIADHSSLFFQPYLQIIVFPLLDYLETTNETFQLFSFGFHSLVLEFLVTLSIHETKKIKKCKGPNQEKEYFVVRILPICLQYMAIIPDDADWEKADTVEQIQYDSSYHDIGEAAFRRCAASFGVKSTYTIISNLLSHYLTNQVWQKVYAGLQCLAGYVEITAGISNKSQLFLHRKEVIQTIHHFSQSNQHPRIRYNALYTASQFLLFHGNELEIVQLQEFIQLIGNNARQQMNPSPRLRRNALIALIQLIDISPASFVSEHVQFFLEIICNALQEGPMIVQESCVSAIISIAETSKGNVELWTKFYPLIMPILKQLLTFSQKKNFESLWCQTLECISVLGESAGKSLFYQDACELMDLLTNIQSTPSSSQQQQHSSLESTLIKTWVRLGRCLGSEFLPYLPSIMEKLFEALAQDITANVDDIQNKASGKAGRDLDDIDPFNNEMEGDEGDDEEDEDNEFQQIETANGWVTIRTSAVEEQSSSLQMILLLTEKLQEYYYPYIEQTIQHLTKLLSSPNEDIRSYSIVILPELIRSTGKALPMNRIPLKELTFYCLGKLVDFLEKESSMDLIMTALQATKQILLFACVDWNDLLTQKASSSIAAITPSSTTGFNDTSSSTGANGAATEGGSEKKNWLRLLDDQQMLTITKSLKSILRESLQRRAVLKAEKQLEEREEQEKTQENSKPQTKEDVHNKDTFEVEDVLNEESMFFQQSLELHYNLSEVINILFQTHQIHYIPIYYQEFHELIMNFTNQFCTKEDKRFAFLIISDVIEFGLNPASSSTSLSSSSSQNGSVPSTPLSNGSSSSVPLLQQKGMIESYLHQLFPILHSYCQNLPTNTSSIAVKSSEERENDDPNQVDYEVLRTIVYIIGIIYEHYSLPDYYPILNQYLTPSLLSLHQIMSVILGEEMNSSNGEQSDEGDVIGFCKDNIISATGMIAQKLFYSFPLTILFPHQQTNNTNNHTQITSAEQLYLGQNIIQIKQLHYLLNQWLQLLPLEYDQDENVKVMKELLQFIHHNKSFSYLSEHPELFVRTIEILMKEIELNRLSKLLLFQFYQILYEIFHHRRWLYQSLSQDLLTACTNSFSPNKQLALQNILFAYPNLLQEQQQQQQQQHHHQQPQHHLQGLSTFNLSPSAASPVVLATSPLATAPIHDILLQMK